MKKLFVLLIMTYFIASCSSTEDKQQTERIETCKQEIDILRPDVEQALKQLAQYTQRVSLQSHELTIEEIENTASVSGILANYQDWSNQYGQVQLRLEQEEVSPEQLQTGYKRAIKELQIIAERVEDLSQKIQ